MTRRDCLTLGVPAAAIGQAAGPEDVYRSVTSRIIQAAMRDREGLRKLGYLCKRIGHRLSGSNGLARAVDWAAARMIEDGLENVRKLPVTVPHWVRGEERARAVAPEPRALTMAGYGGSVGTTGTGLEADVVVAASFEELEGFGRHRVQGRIVLFNAPFADATDRFEGYGKTARYRTQGASRAAELGAVACLVRSLTPSSRRTAHTGAMRYTPAVPRIPAAAVSIDDAEWIARMVGAGRAVRVRLEMSARWLPDAQSANVVGEVRGRQLPDEIVVIGGHLDSWDVGQGAHDDGSGCVASMQAAALFLRLSLIPRRTVRVVLWTNEENGTAGAAAYRSWIGDEIRNHVAAIEMDMGAERPVGFGCSLPPGAETAGPVLARIESLLDPIGAGRRLHRGGGTDLGPLIGAGVPGLWPVSAAERYFDWHHSAADTVDTVAPDGFRRNLAVMAVLAYVIADMPGRLAGPSIVVGFNVV